MDAKARAETICEVVSDPLADAGVVVDDVTVQQAGRRRLVRVLVARDLSSLDQDDETSQVQPLSLDEVAVATRVVSGVLDESDVMGEAPYTLEVSSTGLDRPLTSRDHFRRNVGRLLTVSTTDDRTTTGRLLAAGPTGITLHTPAEERLDWQDVVDARVQVEFSRRQEG
ncbi:MAG: ribosome maturation factor RimP [Brachybacterium sp.]|nr:ribosome maturation factor RimP [Brachybacterium sp.]